MLGLESLRFEQWFHFVWIEKIDFESTECWEKYAQVQAQTEKEGESPTGMHARDKKRRLVDFKNLNILEYRLLSPFFCMMLCSSAHRQEHKLYMGTSRANSKYEFFQHNWLTVVLKLISLRNSRNSNFFYSNISSLKFGRQSFMHSSVKHNLDLERPWCFNFSAILL